MPPDSPRGGDVARRALADELHRLRADAGLSIRQLGRRSGADPADRIPHARIPRIEAGTAEPTAGQLRGWLAAVSASAVTRERVAALARDARGESSRWADLLALTPDRDLQQLAAQREQSATAIDVACQQWLPGLLQSRSYAHALLARLQRDGYPNDPEVATDRRMARQTMLREPGRRFRFLLTRRALTWNPGDVAMSDQIDQIADVTDLDSVAVRVLEADADPVGPWASFTLYEGENAAVFMELPHRGELVLDPADVDRYRRHFEQMWAAATPLRATAVT